MRSLVLAFVLSLAPLASADIAPPRIRPQPVERPKPPCHNKKAGDACVAGRAEGVCTEVVVPGKAGATRTELRCEQPKPPPTVDPG